LGIDPIQPITFLESAQNITTAVGHSRRRAARLLYQGTTSVVPSNSGAQRLPWCSVARVPTWHAAATEHPARPSEPELSQRSKEREAPRLRNWHKTPPAPNEPRGAGQVHPTATSGIPLPADFNSADPVLQSKSTVVRTVSGKEPIKPMTIQACAPTRATTRPDSCH
jgi:hypothetical protein